jgi:putative transposase
VIQRGNNRGACFFADDDYYCYLHWLRKAAADHDVAVHAYVLMTNHVHILATPAKPGALAMMMQSLGRRYVRYVNATYKRSGTLWEGRYKAGAVDAEDYLLRVYRYIELNPGAGGYGGVSSRVSVVQPCGQWGWQGERLVETARALSCAWSWADRAD